MDQKLHKIVLAVRVFFRPINTYADFILLITAATKNGKFSKYETAIIKAGGSIKKLLPAVFQGSKSNAKKDQSEQKKANTLGTARALLIQPCKNAAQSWKDFKHKRHQRKSILPSDLDQTLGGSNDLDSPQESGAGVHTNHDSRGTDSPFSIDSYERLRRRLAAADPLPTTWSSSVSTAGNEAPPRSGSNHSDSDSSGQQIPAPGRLGRHLREMAPDTTLQARLNKSTVELATPRKV